MKEYDEAIEQIASIIGEDYDTNRDWEEYSTIAQDIFRQLARRILNLKSDDWSIELVRWEVDPDTGATNAEIIER